MKADVQFPGDLLFHQPLGKQLQYFKFALCDCKFILLRLFRLERLHYEPGYLGVERGAALDHGPDAVLDLADGS